MQSMNGVDIRLFRFEGDLTWMAFFMDGSDGIYTRYGGREDGEAESHLNQKSLVRVMEQVLAMHQRGEHSHSPPKFPADVPRTPEDIPTMKAMMAPRKESKCIHCHDVKIAGLRDFQAKGQFKREMVFTFPPPSSTGITLNPIVQNQVDAVADGSAAAKAGVRAGDTIKSLDGGRILTLADMSWVLESYRGDASLPLELERGGKTVRTTLKLEGNWRRTKDPSWRESLHVAGPGGGFWGQKLKDDEKEKAGFAKDDLAVRVTAIFGDHARQAGIKNGDIVVEFDGKRTDMTILQLHAHLQLNKEYGDVIPVVVRRDGKNQPLTLRLPKSPPKGE
jgi:predicted metalloprotease with PDZ domain